MRGAIVPSLTFFPSFLCQDKKEEALIVLKRQLKADFEHLWLRTSPSFCVICFAEMGCRRNIKKIDDTVGVVKGSMKDLITDYKILINETLPATYQSPVRFNHCFTRIVLDWLFQDCWYNHLDRRKTAISQLSETQVQRALQRMNEWMMNHQLLIEDNINSLRWRKKITDKNQIK